MWKHPHGTNLNTLGQSTAVKTQTQDIPTPPPSASQIVSTVEELYEMVNKPGPGVTIFLNDGIYTLSDRWPNAGRLELQPGMNLVGASGDPALVIIDASQLPEASFLDPNVPNFRYGVVRVGRGSNTVEQVTIKGHNRANSCIAADLDTNQLSSATVRVANVVCDNTGKPATHGVDFRNFGPGRAGFTLNADVENCRIVGGRQGIRFANFHGAERAQIQATMKNNVLSGNNFGCILANNRANFGTINVRSTNDKFTGNSIGCLIAGGLALKEPVLFPTANGNATTFEGQRSHFTNNNLSSPNANQSKLGIVASGADTPDCPGAASDNRVEIRLTDCTISGNANGDFEAFGARNLRTGGISGKRNTVNIDLQDDGSVNVSARDCVPIEETPEDPVRTNKVTVTRSITS